uniref:Uncharacterized protein n=1 Tax=Arundo donax TaxID=35708 RepID=A0A0A9A9L8_ARUDO
MCHIVSNPKVLRRDFQHFQVHHVRWSLITIRDKITTW